MDSLRGSVRTGSSNADPIQFCHRKSVGCSSISAPTDSPKSQSEGDLAVPEAAERRAEGRPSGKSGAARSDRRETSSGSGGELSAGWREVAEQLHAEEGMGHE